MATTSVTHSTVSLVDQLLPVWQTMTKTEDARALVARSIVNCLLDLRSFTNEYEALDVEDKTPV